MKIKYYVVLLIIFFVSMLLFGCDLGSIGSSDYGTSQLSGYVMDDISYDGIYDAAIVTIPGADSIRTDNNGYFNIPSFVLTQDPQEINLSVNKIGYKTSIVTVKLVSDGKENVTIPMQRDN
jgi:hypothetical protein